MSSYLVLARKYRPKQFSDIVGQQSVVRTLVNAIKLERTHQAYVFSGSRGIGKTSIARIFSKALRCQNVVEKEGLLFSCDECSDCREIAAGNSVNVLEIDGASNNGVDSVREIRESAKFLPSSGKYKIYIIDEVHMLSTQAFNALLKTLEEPPEHVVFIFATTESHKIPETILGRCQRFDFKRVTVAEITQRCKEILTQEKIECEDAAINLIARAAEGSMRDALSILDQVISFSGMRVTAQAVRESIGLIGTELVFALLKTVLERDGKAALMLVQNAFNQGVDLKVLLKIVIEMLHALILIQVGIEKPETHFNDDELKQISTLKTLRPLEENELIFQVYHHGLDLLSRAAQPKLIFDLLMVKTALAEALFKVGVDEEPSSTAPRREARPLNPAPPAQTTSQLPAQSQMKDETMTARPVVPGAHASPAAHVMPEQKEAKVELAPKVEEKTFMQMGQGPQSVPSKPKEAPKVQAGPLMQLDPNAPRTWEGFIEYCFDHRPVLAVILESVIEWTIPQHDAPFKIGFRENDRAKSEKLNQKVFKEQFSSAVETYFGMKIFPEIFFSDEKGESMAERSVRLKREDRDQRLKRIHSNEVVAEAKSLFGVDLTDIELLGSDQ